MSKSYFKYVKSQEKKLYKKTRQKHKKERSRGGGKNTTLDLLREAIELTDCF
jgi:hypothetical protein